jgi:hypothetical protein
MKVLLTGHFKQASSVEASSVERETQSYQPRTPPHHLLILSLFLVCACSKGHRLSVQGVKIKRDDDPNRKPVVTDLHSLFYVFVNYR